MSASADIKQIQITGGDGIDLNSIGKRKRSSSSRKQRKDWSNRPIISKQGHENLILPPVISAKGDEPAKPKLVITKAPEVPSPSPATPSSTTVPEPLVTGGVKVKLVLDKKPQPHHKIHLVTTKGKHNHTKKARKIRVSLTGLGKRMTRHKKIQKEAGALPIDKVKKDLIEAKLIKPESKAPESMLRQIYSDYQTLKNKAL